MKKSFFIRPHSAYALLALDVLVDGCGGILACAHGQYDGGRAGDGVAAGVHALAAGQAVLALGDDAAVLVGFKARGGGADQRVVVSMSSTNSLPSFTMGRRRPEASGSPNSISTHFMPMTSPLRGSRGFSAL